MIQIGEQKDMPYTTTSASTRITNADRVSGGRAMKDCCANCRRRYKLTRFDYSKGGCEHTDMEGYVCMAFANEKQAVWIVGIHEQLDLCECFEAEEDK